MITLTTPIPIVSGFSGATVSYNKIAITNVQFDLVGQGITAFFKLVVSSDPTKPAILGTIVLTTQGTPTASITIPQLNINISFAIASLVAGIQTLMSNFQNQLEAALISQGVVVGTQSAGQ